MKTASLVMKTTDTSVEWDATKSLKGNKWELLLVRNVIKARVIWFRWGPASRVYSNDSTMIHVRQTWNGRRCINLWRQWFMEDPLVRGIAFPCPAVWLGQLGKLFRGQQSVPSIWDISISRNLQQIFRYPLLKIVSDDCMTLAWKWYWNFRCFSH